jgi:HK97 family phage major capsid protein
MRNIVRIFTSESQTKRIPDCGIVTAAMVAEGAGGSQNEPTISGTLLSKKKATANLAATIEEIEDSAFDLVSLFSERAGSAFGVIEDLQIATSNGTAPNITESLGSATITAIGEAGSGILTYADCVTLLMSVPKAYRPFVSFYAAPNVMILITALKDTTGRPIFQGANDVPKVSADGAAADGMILGRPLYELPLASGELFCGPAQEYGMLDGGGITMRVLSETLASTDAILYRFTQRFDGTVLTNAAWRQMEGLTT